MAELVEVAMQVVVVVQNMNAHYVVVFQRLASLGVFMQRFGL